MELGDFVITAEIGKAIHTDHVNEGCGTSCELLDCGITWGF